MTREPKTIEDFEEQASSLLKRLQALDYNITFSALRPIARELLDAYQQGIQDNITGRA